MNCPKCCKQIVMVRITHCEECKERGCAACLRYVDGLWICEKCKDKITKEKA